MNEELFKDHKAEYKELGHIKELIFRKANTSMYFIRYLFVGNKMIITGDFGNAIFEFTETATPKKIIEYNDLNYYIMSKYSCGDGDKYIFDEKQFNSDFIEYKKTFTPENRKKYKEDFDTLKRCANDANTVGLYKHYITESLNELKLIEVDEDYEFYNLGQKLNPIFNLYYEGLKLAWKQIEWVEAK